MIIRNNKEDVANEKSLDILEFLNSIVNSGMAVEVPEDGQGRV